MFKKKNKFNDDFVSFNKTGGIEAPPEKIPDFKVQPPMIFGFFVLISLLFNYFFIQINFKVIFMLPIGVLISIFGIVMNMWAMNKYRLYKTSPHPKHQPFKLIIDGPYKFSRNPLYLGTFFMIFGFGLASGIWLMCVASILSLIFINFLVVIPEEKYMQNMFGTDFDLYVRKVRRWL